MVLIKDSRRLMKPAPTNKDEPSTYEDFKRIFKLTEYLSTEEVGFIDAYVATNLPKNKWKYVSVKNKDDEPGIIDTVDYFLGSGWIAPEYFFKMLAYSCAPYSFTFGEFIEQIENYRRGIADMRILQKKAEEVYESTRQAVGQIDESEISSPGITKFLYGLTPEEAKIFCDLFGRTLSRQREIAGPFNSRKTPKYPIKFYIPELDWEFSFEEATKRPPYLLIAPFIINSFLLVHQCRIPNEFKIRVGYFMVFWKFIKMRGSYLDTGDYFRKFTESLNIKNAKSIKKADKIYIPTKFPKTVTIDWEHGRIVLPILSLEPYEIDLNPPPPLVNDEIR